MKQRRDPKTLLLKAISTVQPTELKDNFKDAMSGHGIKTSRILLTIILGPFQALDPNIY